MLPAERKLPEGLAIAAQSAEFWRRLAPELTISDGQPRAPISRQADLSRKEQMRLINDGYLHLKQPGLQADLAKLAAAMVRIGNAGMPPSFVGVYDEIWSVAGQLSEVMNVLLGGKAQLVPDFQAILNDTDFVGSTPKRQRPSLGVFDDGTPKSASLWVPLTQSTAENGCVYAVPARFDRNYGKTGATRADASLMSIRALPMQPGDILVMSGETYHWQSRAERHNADGPQLALKWEFQSREIAPLDGTVIDSFPYVSFETRLAILAQQFARQNPAKMTNSPIWRAVQQTLANRYPLRGSGMRA